MKDLNYYKNNCEEDYIKTPISVLRYITELEKNNETKQLTLTDVSQHRELFDAILDFSEELPMCTEDYHRSELWEKYKALNCG